MTRLAGIALLAAAVGFCALARADPAQMRASELLGRAVHVVRGAPAGEITELLLDRGGGEAFAVAKFPPGAPFALPFAYPLSALSLRDGLLSVEPPARELDELPGRYVRASRLLAEGRDVLLNLETGRTVRER